MTFADIVRIVVRRWPIVLVITLAGAVLGGGFAARAGTTYTATSTLIINPSPTASRADLVATNSYIQSRMDSYRSMATTSKVLGPVAERLNLGGDNDVASMITVQVPTNSTMVSIAAESPRPPTGGVVVERGRPVAQLRHPRGLALAERERSGRSGGGATER